MSDANPYETTTVHTSGTPRRTVTLKRIDVVSVGVMLAVFYAILGLIAGGFFSLFAIIGVAAQNGNAIPGLIFGIGAIIVMPLTYGTMGFIFGAIGALLYNACASLVGGIKFDLE